MLDNYYSGSRDIPFILPYNETSLRQLVASGLDISNTITTIQFFDNIGYANRRTTGSPEYFRNCLTDVFSYHVNTSFSCPRYHSQHNHSARTKKSGMPSTFLNLLEARPIAVAYKKTHLFADLERGTTKRLWRNLEEARKVGAYD